MTPKATPDYPGILERAKSIAKEARENGLPSLDFIKPVGHDGEHHPVRREETCWKDGCDLDATNDYWCETHYAQRRAHIQNEMAKLAEAEFEVKPLDPIDPIDTSKHDVDLIMTRQRWQWKCSCGLVGKTMARTEGIAKAAGDRHRRAMGVVEYL